MTAMGVRVKIDRFGQKWICQSGKYNRACGLLCLTPDDQNCKRELSLKTGLITHSHAPTRYLKTYASTTSRLSGCLSACLCLSVSVCLCIFVCVSVCLCVSLSLCQSVCQFVFLCLSFYLAFLLYLLLSFLIHPSISLSLNFSFNPFSLSYFLSLSPPSFQVYLQSLN